MVWLDESPLNASRADDAVRALENASRVKLVLAPGVHRAGLMGALEKRSERQVATVLLPPLDDADAPLHGLLQAASSLGKEAVARALDDGVDLGERAWNVARELAKEGQVLAVWVPPSWQRVRASTPEGPGMELRCLHAAKVLDRWLAEQSLPIMILASSGALGLGGELAKNAEGWPRIDVAPEPVSIEVLQDARAWGDYADAAAALHKGLAYKRMQTLFPWQMRLLVGLVGLGEAPGALLSRFGPSQRRTTALENYMREVLTRPKHDEVREGLVRIARARFPVERQEAREIAALPEEHLPLLTICIGTEAGDIEIEEDLRQQIARLARNRPDPAIHLRLAAYHQSLDGAPSARDAGPHMRDWLEKVHNLGRAGTEATGRWSDLDLPSRELYWDRARSLSIEHHAFVEAAALYRECLRKFDDRDAYSWHYLGFNLDRAGALREEAEHALRKAVELRPTHPWYNGRLVTFLIDQARFRDAEAAWAEVLERMDPRGEAVHGSPWLAGQMHRWVVKAWLGMGEVSRAREVFDDIPEEMVSREEWFQKLRHELLDSEEAVRLGESVYPPETPMSERWTHPPAIVSEHDASRRPLRHWFPGRVVAASEDEVNVALAVPHADPDERRIIARALTAGEWRTHAGFCPPEEALGRYFVLAIYEEPGSDEEVIRIYPVKHEEHRLDEEEMRLLTRYIPASLG
ncbi:hypothetical protein [Chondromyces apiculatus]|uniref:Tetratricopeptide repeat protein n=1 Tax=Chondromyces apiculatus DSM 436 TaxID=1192034 RepID=A0A017T2Q9_9BACT|nr:hypothetical protein [Chondromyces apiculatus]EYF03110.1 Hypothetical protein CAP_6224 [Chondromyces apiculatus DSM 436]